MVFAFKKKNALTSLSFEKFQSLLRMLKEVPPSEANFLKTLHYFIKLIEARSVALYLYEAKTGMFLLKTWVNSKPTRFSFSEDYEFIKFLKLSERPIDRFEFAKSSHELRQAALFFFQQTSSTKALPIRYQDKWLGIMAFDMEKKKEETNQIYNQMILFYAEQIKYWLLYQNLQESHKKLSEIGQVKNQLLANVTHELQTPLNGILGITEALLDETMGELPKTLETPVSRIHQSGKELHETVNNILKMTQIEAHKNEMKLEKVNILSLIEEVVFLFQKAIEEKQNQCVIPAKSQAFDVFVEQDQIRTVLMNLIGNAIKFTSHGEISIDLEKNGEMLHVSVGDTGEGIDDDKLDMIFEEFVQADGSHTRMYGGTGLGLAIAKKIINLHGGRIWVESKKGYGSKFTFTIPLFPKTLSPLAL